MTLGAWKRDYREKVVIDDPSVSRFGTLQDVKIAHRRLAKQAIVVETSVNSGVGQIRAPKWARSNCQTHLLSALVAYTYQEKKPSLNLHPDDLAALPATIF